jgi:hypothetical protein
MIGSRFDRTACHVPVKHTASNSNGPIPVLDDVNLSIANPMPQGPRPDSEVAGGVDDIQKVFWSHILFSGAIRSPDTA